MESKVRVMLLAHSNAGDSIYTKGKKQFLDIFDNTKVEFVTKNADILVFLTNNSALSAIEEVQNDTYRHYLMMAATGNRAYASAVEVKAWMNQHAVSSALLEYESLETRKVISDLYDIKNAFERIDKKRVYIPNEQMGELVASNVSPFVVDARFGVQLGYKADSLTAGMREEACAGDVCSMMGMLLINEVCGQLPRVAEISKIAGSSIHFEACEASVVLADCCGFQATHLDSLQGSDDITIFRLDSTLSKAFVMTAKVRKRNAQPLSVGLVLAEQEFDYFTENPLGNHHLIVSGNHAEKLVLACHLKKIAIV